MQQKFSEDWRLSLLFFWNPAAHLPFFKPLFRQLDKIRQPLRDFFRGQVEKHKKALDLNSEAADFTDAYLQQMEKEKKTGGDTSYCPGRLVAPKERILFLWSRLFLPFVAFIFIGCVVLMSSVRMYCSPRLVRHSPSCRKWRTENGSCSFHVPFS